MNSDTIIKINETLLDEKLASLEKARQWSPRVVSRIESLIRSGDDLSLFRVNPIRYAKEKGMDEQEGIDLFLHATAIGLFEMNWSLLCPGCTSVVESFSELKNLNSRFHCEICNADTEASLDDFIQISFTVSHGIRDIVFHHPDQLSETDYLTKYRFSREGVLKGMGRWIDVMIERFSFYGYVTPNERKTFTGRVEPGYLIIVDLLNHLGAALTVDGSDAQTTIRASLSGSGITVDMRSIPAGAVALDVANDTPKRSIIVGINLPAGAHDEFTIFFEPYLSGKRLLTTQAFHDLFRHEVILGSESLGVKDISIIFTDLKASTSLYERIGDLKAFSLVRQHFDALEKVVTANSGAIVKTIGDAVMGSFMNPADAVKAAIEMRNAVRKLNQTPGHRDLILKIGIHKGASIIVNMNERLDYFGQTVNIASRVQELADADEIYITGDVYTHPGVRESLEGLTVKQEKAKLKGIMDEMDVYNISA